MDPRSEAIIAAYQEVVIERLDEGLRAMQQSSIKAMHEVAREVWRTSEADEETLKERLLAELSKDQAIRGMLTHTDERFQSLAVRVASIEDNIAAMSQATRDLRDSIERNGPTKPGGSAGEATAAAPPIGAEEFREMLAPIAEQIRLENAEAADRTGERVAELEGHVKEGIAAVGRLAEVVQDEVVRIDALAEREESEGTESQAPVTEAIGEAVNGGLARLATMMRSDNSKLADLVKSGPEGSVDPALAQLLDARLGRMSELVSATTMSAVNEIVRNLPEGSAPVNATGPPADKLEEMMMSMDRNFVGLTDTLESQLRRMSHAVAEHTAESVDRSIGDRMNANLERLSSAIGAIETNGGNGNGNGNGNGLGEATSTDIAAIVDDRLTQLAKMIRADNKALAGALRVTAGQNDLIPHQVAQAVDKRMGELSENFHRESQSMVEAIAAMADALARRIDRATMSVHERFDRATKRPTVRKAVPPGR